MKINIEDKKVRNFLSRLEELYSLVEEFCRENGLEYRYSKVEIYEEFAGKYETKEMYVYKDKEFLFKLKPVGAYIIAADGRVDLIGKFDEKRIIFLEKDQELWYRWEGKEFKKIGLYTGFEGKGWYISLEGKKIRLLTKELLCQLLEDISEFKCSKRN
jgi:hypothetical protein